MQGSNFLTFFVSITTKCNNPPRSHFLFRNVFCPQLVSLANPFCIFSIQIAFWGSHCRQNFRTSLQSQDLTCSLSCLHLHEIDVFFQANHLISLFFLLSSEMSLRAAIADKEF